MRNSLLRRYAAAQGGQLTERERADAVKETCLRSAPQCAPMMARWIVDTPVSPERDRMRSKLAAIEQVMNGGRLNVADQLVALYDDANVALPEHVTPAQANEVNRLYAELYHHAVPFSRQRLLKLWRRCEADSRQVQACFTERVKLKRTLGDLGS